MKDWDGHEDPGADPNQSKSWANPAPFQRQHSAEESEDTQIDALAFLAHCLLGT